MSCIRLDEIGDFDIAFGKDVPKALYRRKSYQRFYSLLEKFKERYAEDENPAVKNKIAADVIDLAVADGMKFFYFERGADLGEEMTRPELILKVKRKLRDIIYNDNWNLRKTEKSKTNQPSQEQSSKATQTKRLDEIGDSDIVFTKKRSFYLRRCHQHFRSLMLQRKEQYAKESSKPRDQIVEEIIDASDGLKFFYNDSTKDFAEEMDRPQLKFMIKKLYRNMFFLDKNPRQRKKSSLQVSRSTSSPEKSVQYTPTADPLGTEPVPKRRRLSNEAVPRPTTTETDDDDDDEEYNPQSHNWSTEMDDDDEGDYSPRSRKSSRHKKSRESKKSSSLVEPSLSETAELELYPSEVEESDSRSNTNETFDDDDEEYIPQSRRRACHNNSRKLKKSPSLDKKAYPSVHRFDQSKSSVNRSPGEPELEGVPLISTTDPYSKRLRLSESIKPFSRSSIPVSRNQQPVRTVKTALPTSFDPCIQYLTESLTNMEKIQTAGIASARNHLQRCLAEYARLAKTKAKLALLRVNPDRLNTGYSVDMMDIVVRCISNDDSIQISSIGDKTFVQCGQTLSSTFLQRTDSMPTNEEDVATRPKELSDVNVTRRHASDSSSLAVSSFVSTDQYSQQSEQNNMPLTERYDPAFSKPGRLTESSEVETEPKEFKTPTDVGYWHQGEGSIHSRRWEYQTFLGR